MGSGKPEDHLDFAFSNGCDGLAITEHGNMNSFPHIFFHSKKMKEERKKF